MPVLEPGGLRITYHPVHCGGGVKVVVRGFDGNEESITGDEEVELARLEEDDIAIAP